MSRASCAMAPPLVTSCASACGSRLLAASQACGLACNSIKAFVRARASRAYAQVACVDPGGVRSAIWENTIFAKFPIKQIIEQVYAPIEDAAAIIMHAATVPWSVDAEQGGRGGAV